MKPEVMIKVMKNPGIEMVEEGIQEMTRWTRIRVIDLDGCRISDEGAGRLAEVLG